MRLLLIEKHKTEMERKAKISHYRKTGETTEKLRESKHKKETAAKVASQFGISGRQLEKIQTK